jgi:nicotinate-nucleotide adenylyltransferase
MKIGLFFGSFNPIHIGHLIIANAIASSGELNKVWMIVSPQNPLKPAKSLLHEFDRYDLVKSAVADNPKLEVSDVEFHLPKPSYTIDTLAWLTEKHPGKEFKLILGEDALESFPRWKNYQQILDHYGLLVYPRFGVTNSDLKRHKNVMMIDSPLLDISATYIRQCIRNNKSIRYLVPDSVEQMIWQKQFYK